MFNLTSDFKYAASQIQRDGSGLALWSPGPRGHFFPEHQDVVPRGNVCVCVWGKLGKCSARQHLICILFETDARLH